MNIQFLYHPENDSFVAEKIIEATGIKPLYSLAGLSIKEVGPENNGLYESIAKCDVLILLIGSTFNKIAPIIWMNAIQNRKGIFGINIHTIPDDWGETTKKSSHWNTEAFVEGLSVGNLCKSYELPANSGIAHIQENIEVWCREAVNNAMDGYGLI